MKDKTTNQPPGPGVDAEGRTAIDPTANVVAILEAAVRRQDDLRDMALQCTNEVMALRAAYDDKLREAEAKRIDAIRAVDVAAVQRAAEVSADQAQTLANQVAVSAEALRAQVATVATATSAALAAALDPLQKRIEELSRAQYEQQGMKQQVVEGRAGSGAIYAFVGAALGVIGLAVAIIVAVAK